MKILILSLFLFIATICLGQDNFYLGTSISFKDNSFLVLQYEKDAEKIYFRTEIRSDFISNHCLYAKMAFRIYNYAGIELYGSIMPFYGHWRKGYKTPINIEIQYKECLMINFDFYTDQVVPSIQGRIPLNKLNKLK